MPAIASDSRYLSPPQVAKRFGVDVKKIIGWIRSGELRAVNLANSMSSRPRWKISPDALSTFLATRTAGSAPSITRQRRRKPEWQEYF